MVRGVVALLIALAGADRVRAADVDYRRDIKPILKAKCYSCHGAINQEAGLRLDTGEFIRSGGDSGAAIDLQSVDDSLILQRVVAEDEYERMPPEGEPLTKRQVEHVRAWITGGAKTPDDEMPQSDPQTHWSFQPLNSVSPPDMAAHPIDAFIDRRLRQASLYRSPPADAITIVRRMFLDLHGLPPTLGQTSEWVSRIEQDRSQIRRLADQLLASPRYGERWAQHWLDVVRYADTHGFEVNTPRPNAWPYRDYVIASLNADKPYDQFVREQIVGDQLGHDAATGFLVAAAALLPGQIGKDAASMRLARQDALDEMIVGTSATFLAMTVGCARCHDHKFDPITQQDYYSLQAFFAGVDYGDRNIDDEYNRNRLRAADSLQPEIDKLSEQLAGHQPRAFVGRTIIIDDEDTEHVTLLATKNGHGTNPDGTAQGYRQDPGDHVRMPNLSGGRYTWWPNQAGVDVFTWDPQVSGRYRLWISWGVHGSGVHTRDARYVLDLDGDLSSREDQTEIARADQYYFANVREGESEKKPLWSGLLDTGVHQWQPSTRLVLRGGETSTGITADVIVLQQDNGQTLPLLRSPVHPAKNVETFDSVTAKFVRFTSRATIDDNRHQPCIDELEVFATGSAGENVALASRGTIATSSGNYADTTRHRLANINDGKYGNEHSWISDEYGKGWVQLEFTEPHKIDRIEWARDRLEKFRDRLSTEYEIETSLNGVDWQLVASSTDRVATETPTDPWQWVLRQAGDQESQKRIRTLAAQLQELTRRQDKLREPRQVFAGVFREPDPTHLLNRGDPEQPMQALPPQIPSIFGSLGVDSSAGESLRRTRLADWLTSSENPLTARVIANRIWQYHFGIGLVETSSDFGINGASPSHPQLLDWLAGELIRSGWSIKHLHRLILSSQTYQQQSTWQSRTRPPSNPEVALDPHPATLDADNRWLWQFPTRRLEAEAIRDCMLAVSGQLNLETGGPGFDFFQTRGGLSGFPEVEQFGADGMKRMIYSHKIRMERVPVFGAFDCPDAGLPTPRRSQSTTAIQALNLFNSDFVIGQSDVFARRIQQAEGDSIERQIELAFRIALCRMPSDQELQHIRPVVAQHGLSTLCRVLLNSNEFLFVP